MEKFIIKLHSISKIYVLCVQECRTISKYFFLFSFYMHNNSTIKQSLTG